jgi:uncharacterized damage-inducible protein DinB
MADYDPVGTISFYRERHRVESATTGRVLRAMSAAMLEYRPHPNSSTIGVTAWTIVSCLRICNELTGSMSAEAFRDSPPAYEDLVAEYARQAQSLTVRLLGMTQENWETERTVIAGGKVLLQQPLGQILWLFHVDAIHHRGQISTSLRPLGAKVPPIYGPSGDYPV